MAVLVAASMCVPVLASAQDPFEPVAPVGEAAADDTEPLTGTLGPEAPATPVAQPAPVVAPLPPPPPSLRDEKVGIPLRIGMTGFYRARLNHIKNVPTDIRTRTSAPGGQIQAADRATYAFMNFRLRPHIKYGPKEDAPIAALYMEADAFSNVVFGDNVRNSRVPLFAENPSLTNNEGFDLRDSFLVRRAWAEFLIPIGQMRVGRMPLEWGLGILAQNDNRLQDWGDPQFGSTVDRILFATRPLTVYNALAKGDARTTPLIFALAYDKLVKDPINDLVTPPVDAQAERDTRPFGHVSRRDNDVNQINVALAWSDPDFGPRASDNLFIGYFMLYRWQNFTNSKVLVHDVAFKLRHGLGPGLPSFFTEGEFVTIHGSQSGALPFADPTCTQLPCAPVNALIFGAAGRVGLIDEREMWKAWLEVGYSSGDEQYLASDKFTVRPFHPDYRVGLLTYQVAMAARTAYAFSDSALTEEGSRALWSRGGVWNSKYFWPQVKYTLIPGIEVHGALLLSWADKVVIYPPIYAGEPGNCGFGLGCFVGLEVNGALRVRWGDNDLMWFDLEGGFMRAGDALSSGTFVMENRNLWTIQSRIAMQF
jgi:hypothetical protein